MFNPATPPPAPVSAGSSAATSIKPPALPYQANALKAFMGAKLAQYPEIILKITMITFAEAYVKRAVTEAVNNMLGDDMDAAIKQAISGIVASLAAEMADRKSTR